MEEAMEENIKFVTWPSIRLLHNVIKDAKFHLDGKFENKELGSTVETTVQTPVHYKGKIKLHGQNGGILIQNPGRHLKVQSRSIFIGENTAFGQIVFGRGNETYFKSLTESAGLDRIVIFGEYCGPKVQKGVALTKLPNDIFAIFSIQVGDTELMIEPDEIENFLTVGGTKQLPSNVYIIPWHIETTIDFNLTPDEIQSSLENIEEEVRRIDVIDPWVKSTFGIEGPGEGIVFYPIPKDGAKITSEFFETLSFKVKGAEHRVVATKTAVTTRPEVMTNGGAENFAKLICPERRLEQGAETIGIFDVKKMKEFLNWVVKDVKKEGELELTANNLKWNDVLPHIRKLASVWYKNKCIDS